jgi:hypothetical protein
MNSEALKIKTLCLPINLEPKRWSKEKYNEEIIGILDNIYPQNNEILN